MAFDENDGEEREEDLYGSEGREELEDNDEISPEEGAFMEGYESDYEEDEPEEAAAEGEEETSEQPAAEEEEL